MRKITAIATAAAMLAAAGLICVFAPNTVFIEGEGQPVAAVKKVNEVSFSAANYFYSEDVALRLTSEKNTDIFYTLDSTPPNSDSGLQYTEELILKAAEDENVNSYTVKACVRYGDGSFSDVYTHSYFVGKNVSDRFDTPVFCLSTDPNNLYDYDTGIFVAGKIREEYIAENGGGNIIPTDPANFNMRGMDWEKPVYVEVIDSDGSRLAAQNCGMRTFGGYSRDMGQKSIKLYARSEYDEKNSFDFDIFNGETDYSGMGIHSYKRLVLRNSANDNPFAFMRDEVVQSCAAQTGLDTQGTRACAVFLNGEYYGFSWVHESYDSNYFDDKNRIDTDYTSGSWTILKGSEQDKSFDEDDEAETAAASEYAEMYEKFSSADLTNDELFGELCGEIDIDNFLTYYAVQIYIANGDWPRGNYKVYRYNGTAQGGTADGKWRWLLYDTDFGLGLYGCSPNEDSLGIILGESGTDEAMRAPLLKSVLRRGDMRDKFSEIMCDLMNGAFSPVSILKTVRAKESERMNELEWNFRLGGAQLGNTWSSLDYVENDVRSIQKFGNERPEAIKKQLEKYLGVSGGFKVSVKRNENAEITVNSCNLNDIGTDFSGFYYDGGRVVISAEIAAGKVFEGWLVNGGRELSPVLTVTEDAEVELLTKPAEGEAKPIIVAVDYETGEDRIVILNPYNSDIRLKKYFISDDAEDLYKQLLPDYTLKAGETAVLYCRNYSLVDAMGGLLVGFSLSPGETLSISDSEGAVDQVSLPDIRNVDYYEKNLLTGKWHDTTEWKYDEVN